MGRGGTAQYGPRALRLGEARAVSTVPGAAVIDGRPTAPTTSTGAGARPHPGRVLRGRDRELEVIGEGLASAAAGRGGVLLVDGAPGVGKSRLLAEAAAMARRLGVRP